MHPPFTNRSMRPFYLNSSPLPKRKTVVFILFNVINILYLKYFCIEYFVGLYFYFSVVFFFLSVFYFLHRRWYHKMLIVIW